MKDRLRHLPFFMISLCVCSFFFLSGCSSKEKIPRATVSGTVSFEGEPIKEGSIIFVPVVGVQGAPVQLEIRDGKYSSSADPKDSRGVVIGSNDVQIFSTKSTGKMVKNPLNELVPEIVQAIPVKFNEQTELNREIKAGAQELNFDLKP